MRRPAAQQRLRLRLSPRGAVAPHADSAAAERRPLRYTLADDLA